MAFFYNPYAFVPARHRPPDPNATWTDGPPEAQGLLRDGRWTGRLRLLITAVTPLLIGEQERDGEIVRRSTRMINGMVALAPTSLKGMLRTEYEMLTGSRFGVFDEHGRLGHRIAAAPPKAESLLPVRIGERPDGRKHAVVCRGDTANRTLAAAWVPRYAGPVVPLPSGLRSGDPVHAWVIRMRREIWKDNRWVLTFRYWRVIALGSGELPAPTVDVRAHERSTPRRKQHLVDDGRPTRITGWYLDTGPNIENKHDERVFFNPDRAELPLTDAVVDAWAALLASYRGAHTTDELANTRTGNGGLPWSPHLHPDAGLDALPPGTLCYAAVTNGQVTGLYPVAVSRKLYDRSPRELAAATGLLPAVEHAELSPADRLFGWVPPDGRGDGRDEKASTRAVRGRVRLGAVRTVAAVVEPVGRTLAVLERPRPTQDLFYAAGDRLGAPLDESSGYREGQGLRGRKVYPHQPATTWGTDRAQPWLLHGDGAEPGNQSAYLRDRVAAGAVFEVDLHVENLTDDELGALLCVLTGPSNTTGERFHKLGGGRPLGFGSVTVALLDGYGDVRDAAAWRSFFALDDEIAGSLLDETRAAQCTDAVWKTVPRRTRNAYEGYLGGFPPNADVHYPNDPTQPDSDVDRYAWFVANRRRREPRALPALGTDTAGLALPTDPRTAP